MWHRSHNSHINRYLFYLYDPLVNLFDLEVFQHFRFHRDTIYFIVVEVGAKLRRPQVTGVILNMDPPEYGPGVHIQ